MNDHVHMDWLNLTESLEPGMKVFYSPLLSVDEGGGVTYRATVISVQEKTVVIEFADGQVKAVPVMACTPEK